MDEILNKIRTSRISIILASCLALHSIWFFAKDPIPMRLEAAAHILTLEIWPESGGSRVSGYTWSQQA